MGQDLSISHHTLNTVVVGTAGRLEFAFYILMVALGGCGRYSIRTGWKVDMPHDLCQGRPIYLMVVALENQVGSTR